MSERLSSFYAEFSSPAFLVGCSSIFHASGGSRGIQYNRYRTRIIKANGSAIVAKVQVLL
jgi:hypothetical protein